MDNRRSIPSWLPAVAETVLALLVAMGITLVLTLPLVTVRSEYMLESRDGGDEAVSDLIRRIGEQEIGDSVEVLGDVDRRRLVVDGRPLLGMLRDGVPAIVRAVGLETTGSPRVELSVGQIVQRSARLALSIQALVFLVVGGVLIRLRLHPVATPPRPLPARVVLLGLLGGGAAFAISLVIGLVMSWIGLPVQEQQWARELLRDRDNLVRLVPWIVIIVPFSEEVFFRGYMLRFVSQRAGVTAGVVTSSVLFAFVHLNATGIVIYLAIGGVLAWIYLRSESIACPVLAHMVYNALVLFASVIVAPP